MPLRQIEVNDKESVLHPGIELCRFGENTYLKAKVLHHKKRILLLGGGKLAQEIYQVVISERLGLMEIVGTLLEGYDQMRSISGVPGLVGTHEHLAQVVEEQRVNTIVVCFEDRRLALPVEQLLKLKAMGIDVLDGHKLFEEVSGRLSVDSLRPSAVIFSSGFKQPMIYLVTKRFIDLLLSIGGGLVLLPVCMLIAFLIKVDSQGPVIYRQARVGWRGKPFLIWKFRSMQQDAERSGPQWAQADDPRISRVGRWLRKGRLDEIPQLINVIRGEMSLVGPRPERPEFVQDLRKILPYYDLRHMVRPGITGWAQVKFRYGASTEDAHMKLQYDLYYVKRLSLTLDIKILAKTVRVVLLGEGAY